MMFEVLDGDKNYITKQKIEKFTDFYTPSNPVKKVPDFIYEDVLQLVDYDVNIFIPYKDGEDFIVQHLSKLIKNHCKIKNDEEIKGCLFSEVFPVYVNIHILNLLQEAFKKKTSIHFQINEYPDDNLLFKHYDCNIIISGDLAFLLIKDDTDLVLNQLSETKSIFENSPYGLAIYQDDKFVKVNAKFLEMIEISQVDFSKKDYDFENVHLHPLDYSMESFNERTSQLLINKIFQTLQLMEFNDSKGETHCYNITGAPIQYNHQNAALFKIFDYTKNKNIYDKSLTVEKALKLVESHEKFALLSYDSQKGFFVTDEFFNILETEPFEIHSNIDNLLNFLTLEDKINFNVYLNKLCENQVLESDFHCTVKLKNDKIKHLLIFNKIISWDDDGIPASSVSYMLDETETVLRERRLECADHDKTVLLKEIHHRVKNNLQIILSLISLDERYNKNDLKSILDSTKSRIEAMALIHQKTYESENLSHVNVEDFFKDYCHSILNLYELENEIIIHYDINNDIEFSIDYITPLSLIINEFVTNSVKYAFPSTNQTEKNIFLSIKVVDDEVILKFKDNGIGLPEDLNIYNSPSLGLTIINNLTVQINGELFKEDCEGAGFKLVFPIK